jgi:hypothetical protein
MAVSEFSWLKIASFIGALLLVVVCIITLATGISILSEGNVFRGVICTISALINGCGAVLVYKNYQEKSRQ